MTLLRSLAYQVFLIASVALFGITIAIAGRFVPYRTVGRLGRAWGLSNLFALKHLCGLNYRITGLEHLPATTAIVLCKHQSAWETIALRGLFPSDQTWVLKRELLRIPILGSALRQFVPIAIDRSAGRKAVKQLLKDGAISLKDGRWVMIFPEGTRVAAGTRIPYSIGGALLAERTGYPVVPVAHNAGVFWGRRSLIKRPGTIELVIGEVIASKGRTAQEINQKVEQWIETTVSSLAQSAQAPL
ncbi:lysophospholipid acyltransferase family protein [uncultured Thiodictyon sp.]|uniref:lysophospholipid acyltransferase family protein n=1 Tax=uncultured Thiodictyon sp. TaxID=1846217 RepID=UPI0025ECAA4B|nr:lysophospholipid acyltransferase family protein [uncultured Thiodictyon sp.]